MSAKYLHAVRESLHLVERLIEAASNEYITMILADHGGHGRTHGALIDEDMTIPVILHGKGIRYGAIERPVSILDNRTHGGPPVGLRTGEGMGGNTAGVMSARPQ